MLDVVVALPFLFLSVLPIHFALQSGRADRLITEAEAQITSTSFEGICQLQQSDAACSHGAAGTTRAFWKLCDAGNVDEWI